jgi:hypothetical protein
MFGEGAVSQHIYEIMLSRPDVVMAIVVTVAVATIAWAVCMIGGYETEWEHQPPPRPKVYDWSELPEYQDDAA